MPFRPHYRVTALGRLGTSGEQFSYGLNIAPNNGTGSAGGVEDTISYNTAAWQDVADDFVTFHSSAGALISTRAVLERVKVAKIDADGKYMNDPLIFDVADTPGGAPTTGIYNELLIPQAAMAISLVTGRRGPTGKGRFYIPMPYAQLQSDLSVDDTTRNGINTAAQTLLNNVNNAPGFDVNEYAVCVSSTKGYNTRVIGVRTGSVVDTIRSRRRSLNEDYSTTLTVS